MAWTAQDVIEIEQAIRELQSGKRRTKFVIDGEVAEYAAVDLPQLRALLADVKSAVAENDPESTTIRGFCFTGGKGL